MTRRRALPDRLQHPHRVAAEGVLCRRAARRSGALNKLRGKKVIIGATAIELGDRFSVPNGRVISGPVLQILAAELILQSRTLRWTSDVITLGGLVLHCAVMMLSWRRLAASARWSCWSAWPSRPKPPPCCCRRSFPFILDTSLLHIAIAGYFAAIALDEIDFRALLGRIAESRFQRIAMSLGDGLVCTDSRRPDHGLESRRGGDLRLSSPGT